MVKERAGQVCRSREGTVLHSLSWRSWAFNWILRLNRSSWERQNRRSRERGRCGWRWEDVLSIACKAHLERSSVLLGVGVLDSDKWQWGRVYRVTSRRVGFSFFVFLFISGCTESSLLHGLSLVWWAGAAPHCVGFSLWGFLRCRAQALRYVGFSSCGAWAKLLQDMCDLPRAGVEPVSSALAGRFLTPGPPGMSQVCVLKRWFWPLISWFWGGQWRACWRQHTA